MTKYAVSIDDRSLEKRVKRIALLATGDFRLANVKSWVQRLKCFPVVFQSLTKKTLKKLGEIWDLN